MSQHLVIDSIQFALQGSTLEGKLELSALSRLAGDVLVDSDNFIQYVLCGAVGDRGEPLLSLRLDGCLALRCQRCLQPLSFKLRVETTFELRESLGDETLMQEDLEDDSRDFLAASRSMDLLSLIEDEALLALPPVPKHDACAAPEMRHDPEAASPFGMLLNLKGQSGKTH